MTYFTVGAAIGSLLILSAAVTTVTKQITPLIEAVNMIEEAARSIEEDMQILRQMADEQQCYEDRGEWSDEHGCFLQEVGQ